MPRSMEQITEEMRQYTNSKGFNIKDFITNPVAMTCIETSAHQIELLENMAENIRKHFFIDDAEGEELDKRLHERGLTLRFPGKKAAGFITADKNSPFIIGSTILKDTVFKTLDDTVELIVTSDTNIVVGQTSAAVPVSCTDVGSKGNLLPNTELTYSGVAIDEVEVLKVGPDGLSGGIDRESDEEIRLRIREDQQKTATSANKNHCIKWAKEVEGVGDAICIPLWKGQNTAKVIIVDKDKKPASAELVKKVQDYMDPGITGTGDGVAMIGLYITVESAEPMQITVSAKLVLENGSTLDNVAPLIEANIKAYLKSLVFKESVVRYNHIGDIIYNTEGVMDYSDLLVNGGKENIAVPKTCVPMLGVNTWAM